jgi:hypothetical protein
MGSNDGDGGIMIINSLTILTVVGVCMAIYFSFKLGLEVGYDRGIVDGRKALRKQFEQVGR